MTKATIHLQVKGNFFLSNYIANDGFSVGEILKNHYTDYNKAKKLFASPIIGLDENVQEPYKISINPSTNKRIYYSLTKRKITRFFPKPKYKGEEDFFKDVIQLYNVQSIQVRPILEGLDFYGFIQDDGTVKWEKGSDENGNLVGEFGSPNAYRKFETESL